MPFGIAAFSFILLFSYAVASTISWFTLGFAVMVSLLICYMLYGNLRRAHPRVGRGARKRHLWTAGMPAKAWIATAAVVLFVGITFLTSFYPSGSGIMCRANAACSDLLYHAGVGSSLLYHSFPPEYTFSIGTLDVFPFILDFYTSLLSVSGFGLAYCVLITDAIFVFCMVVLSAALIYRMSKNVFVTSAALFIFWFGTNFIVALPFYVYSAASPANATLPLDFLPQISYITVVNVMHPFNYSSVTSTVFALPQMVISSWSPIIYPMLLPQRGFMLGLSIALAVIYILYMMVIEGKRAGNGELVFIGVSAGMMPLVHPNTFVVLAILFVFVFLYTMTLKSRRRWLSTWMLPLVLSIPLVAVQLYYMTRQPTSPGWYHFEYYGFLGGGSGLLSQIGGTIMNFFVYWFEFLGLIFPLAIIGALLWKGKGPRLMALFSFFILLFISVYSIQPNGGDSDKLLLFSLLFFSIFTGYVLNMLYKRKGPAWKALSILVIVLIAGNSIAIYYNATMTETYSLINSAEVNATSFILNSTPANAVFAVSDYSTLHGIVASIASRQTLISFSPYVGEDATTYPVQSLVNESMAIFETANCSLMKRYNVSYLYYTQDNYSSLSTLQDSRNLSIVFHQTDINSSPSNISIFKVTC